MYEILPQDIKQQERKELTKHNMFEAKNSLSLFQLKSTSNGPFDIEFMAYMGTTLPRSVPKSWVITPSSSIYKLEASFAPILLVSNTKFL